MVFPAPFSPIKPTRSRASTEKFDRIEHLRDRITLHQGDLLDQRSLVDTLRAARPGCRVLMVTTFGRAGYLRAAMAAGVRRAAARRA